MDESLSVLFLQRLLRGVPNIFIVFYTHVVLSGLRPHHLHNIPKLWSWICCETTDTLLFKYVTCRCISNITMYLYLLSNSKGLHQRRWMQRSFLSYSVVQICINHFRWQLSLVGKWDINCAELDVSIWQKILNWQKVAVSINIQTTIGMWCQISHNGLMDMEPISLGTHF